MDAYPNLGFEGRKEIRCRDCGHVYAVAVGQRSSRCAVCGNIEFHGEEQSASPLAAAPRAQTPVVASFSFPPAAVSTYEPPVGTPLPAEEDFLGRFRQTPDGHEVQAILARYQVEWQLWAKLVENFRSPAHHGAYIANTVGQHSFAQATARYQEHRAVMLLSPETRWESEVAELMLSRLETLATLRMQQEGNSTLQVPAWIWLLPLESRTLRLGWFLLGAFLVSRLFHVF